MRLTRIISMCSSNNRLPLRARLSAAAGRIRSVVFLSLWICAVAFAQRTSVPFLPIDEATRDSELMAVRTALIRAAVEYDLSAFIELVSDRYEGGEPARTRVLRTAQRRHLDAVAKVLAGGGVFEREDYFCAPYWHERRISAVKLPPEMVQERFPSAVLVPDTPVFEQPSAESRVITRLGLELVQVVGEDADGFTPVVVSRQKGFVRSTAISPQNVPQEACLQRFVTGWRLATFAAE